MQSDDLLLLCRPEIQCQSYKHNYARPNNNCEIADIAPGQKGMREGMVTIRLSYAGSSKSLDAINRGNVTKMTLSGHGEQRGIPNLSKQFFFLRYVLRCRYLSRYARPPAPSV